MSMLNNLVIILGGAKSGKSSFALDLGKKSKKKVTFLVTASYSDQEMSERIEKHKKSRPKDWKTVEVDKHIVSSIGSLEKEGGLIIVDCWSFYVANFLNREVSVDSGEDIIEPDVYGKLEKQLTEETNSFLREIGNLNRKVIVVSNEVGLGLVPPYPLGRCFRDLLGLSHQVLAKQASKVYFMIAGLPMELSTVNKGRMG